MVTPVTLLVNSSIVFIVQDHNPGMYTPDALREWAVIPEGYRVQPRVLIPPIAQISFGEGYEFEALENRVMFQVNYSTSISKENGLDDELPKFCSNFLEAMSTHLFESVGINFHFVLEGMNLKGMGRAIPEGAQVNQLAFMLMDEGGPINVTYTKGERDTKPFIFADFNFDRAAKAATRKERIGIIKGYVDNRLKYFGRAKELLNESNFE